MPRVPAADGRGLLGAPRDVRSGGGRGAGDGRVLAWAGRLPRVVTAPVALAVRHWAPDGAAGLAWLWLAFAGVFMAARAVTTGLRARGSAWMVTGTA